MMNAYLLGSVGRRPFAGHFRGKAQSGAVRMVWAGRVGSGQPPEQAWAAAEAVRGALEGWPGGHNRTDALQQAWLCLHRMEGQNLQDLSVLFLAVDAEGTVLSGCGLGMVYERVGTGIRAALAADHALLSEPGLPEAPALWFPTGAGPWYGLVHGSPPPGNDFERQVGQP
jgi:hypothetical protein